MFRKLPATKSGMMNERMTRIVMIPERTGNTRSFLSSMRIFQLVFTSLKLLPMLSNILTAWNAKRDEGYAAKVRAQKMLDLKDLCPAPEEEEPKAQSASSCGKRETGRVCGRDNRLGRGPGQPWGTWPARLFPAASPPAA